MSQDSDKSSQPDADATAPIAAMGGTKNNVPDAEPATGYVYATEDDLTGEMNAEAGEASLTHQLLRDGEVIDRSTKDKNFRPGTAVGGVKGSRASDDQLTAGGKPVLPTSSRTTELGAGSKKAKTAGNKKHNKFLLPAAATGALALLAIGGVAIASIDSDSKEPASTEVRQPSETPTSQSASPTPSPSKTTSAPKPSITTRVPEVMYVDPTEEPVDPGTVEYVEDPQPTEEPVVEETPEQVLEEPQPEETVAPAEAAPVEEQTIPAEQVPAEVPVQEVAPVEEAPAVEQAPVYVPEAPAQYYEQPAAIPVETAAPAVEETQPADGSQVTEEAPGTFTQGEAEVPGSDTTATP